MRTVQVNEIREEKSYTKLNEVSLNWMLESEQTRVISINELNFGYLSGMSWLCCCVHVTYIENVDEVRNDACGRYSSKAKYEK